MVSGKQVMQRPDCFWMPLRNSTSKRLGFRPKANSHRQRLALRETAMGRSSEIGHSILPWHDVVMHGDKKRTLSPTCEQQVESEANFAAGRLLFLQDQFTVRVRSSPLTFESVKVLSKIFGNTMTTTLWRAVEGARSRLRSSQSASKPRAAEEPLRYFVRSRRFESQFGTVTAMQVFHSLQGFCFGGRGPIGQSEVIFNDSSGEDYVFFVESFFNTHEALTLGVYRRARGTAVAL